MARNFDNTYSAKVIGQWDFRDGFLTNDTGLADGVAQNGHFHGDASASGLSVVGGFGLRL